MKMSYQAWVMSILVLLLSTAALGAEGEGVDLLDVLDLDGDGVGPLKWGEAPPTDANVHWLNGLNYVGSDDGRYYSRGNAFWVFISGIPEGFPSKVAGSVVTDVERRYKDGSLRTVTITTEQRVPWSLLKPIGKKYLRGTREGQTSRARRLRWPKKPGLELNVSRISRFLPSLVTAQDLEDDAATSQGWRPTTFKTCGSSLQGWSQGPGDTWTTLVARTSSRDAVLTEACRVCGSPSSGGPEQYVWQRHGVRVSVNPDFTHEGGAVITVQRSVDSKLLVPVLDALESSPPEPLSQTAAGAPPDHDTSSADDTSSPSGEEK